MLPQLLVIHKDGVPKIPGYLDSPYNYHRTIEIFISRSYLYSVLFPLNKHLNDTIVIALFIVFLGLAWKFGKKYRATFVFGIATIFLATFLFVVKRPGVSAFYIGYKDAGPAQFFLPQNWIFDFMAGIIFVSLVTKIKHLRLQFVIYLLASAFFVWFMIPNAGSYGRNDFESKTVGNIYANAQTECKTNKSSQNLSVNIYPSANLHYDGLSRQQLCTSAAINYQPQEITLGLTPYQNNYLTLSSKAEFTQTFKSPANNLNGLEIYFSTFTKKVKSPYDLKLMDAACQTTIYTTHIHASAIADNSFYDIPFPTINSSAGKVYCFTVVASKQPADPLAVQLSAPNTYKDGDTRLGSRLSDSDIVFALHYK